MFPIASLLPIDLPLEDPILKFMLIMAIVLTAPLLLNRLRIPYLLGLIIAGAVIGPHGLNLVLRDSSIILSGTAGLLYIMFQSGLEMDMNDFRRNSWRSLVFGLYTFSVPMAFGIFAGHWILGYPILSSILLAALFASQTLIAYPIVSKLGIARDKAVTIAVGGTIITDIMALSVLTVVVGFSTGSADNAFWYRLGISVAVCIAAILVLFPLIGRWFFKRCSDNVSQYVFVLVMVFLGAFLAEAAGLEPIIGAFLAGLAMNRLIPATSPLMNRIEFVGNALFIPFFLIGVGMLIDYRAFFKDWETIEVASVMIVGVTAAKYLAAVLTQKTFRLSRDQRTLIFGLSSAHVAATLAAVMVGYNVILGHTPDGDPIRLLDDGVLNGTILMILATCTVSTFATQRGAHNIALGEVREKEEADPAEQILIPLANEESVPELVSLATLLKPRKLKNALCALHAVNNTESDPRDVKRAQKLLDAAVRAAAASDDYLQGLFRYDVNIVNAIASTVLERNVSDLVMGAHREHGLTEHYLGKTAEGILARNNITTFIYKPVQPISTIQRHWIVIPARAELEAGFPYWVQRLWTLGRNTGAEMHFCGPDRTLDYLREKAEKSPVNARFRTLDDWDTLPDLAADTRTDDALWFVMSRRDRSSYLPAMGRLPDYLERCFSRRSCILIYPVQAGEDANRFGL